MIKIIIMETIRIDILNPKVKSLPRPRLSVAVTRMQEY